MTTAESTKARFWDRLARKYAASPVADPAAYELTLAHTSALLEPDQRVLELGCGTGSSALRLAGATGHYVGTDVSPEMIAIAREKLAAAPQPKLEFAVVDADASLGRECYEVVLAFNLLHLVEDLDHTLRAVVDALVPGGLFISKTPCMAETNPLVRKIVIPVMRWFGKAPPVLSFDAAALQQALDRCGFDIVAIEHHASKGKDPRPFIVARKRA